MIEGWENLFFPESHPLFINEVMLRGTTNPYPPGQRRRPHPDGLAAEIGHSIPPPSP